MCGDKIHNDNYDPYYYIPFISLAEYYDQDESTEGSDLTTTRKFWLDAGNIFCFNPTGEDRTSESARDIDYGNVVRSATGTTSGGTIFPEKTMTDQGWVFDFTAGRGMDCPSMG